MKINKPNGPKERSITKRGPLSSVSVKHSLFLETLQQQDKPQIDLDIVLEQIEQYAHQFRQQATFENLRLYKKVIRAFLSTMVNEIYHVKEKSFIDRYGRRRVFTRVEQIDQKLEELTRLVLSKQLPTIDLAKRIDEIRGLLLDILS